ncbi:hypothetical protein JOC86_004018 [Bacillus pakistanensis]|uniref:Uncharacterized protein n=1 Tax=Rossellomorea pakistanensis TaxID=992288 RepID=A0ABS2NHV2_9BACI|nr:hypothetical protein [Bacillus pakistanensis]MBM7587445.1 hypothetical protein [Bacillus pakistanensis]
MEVRKELNGAVNAKEKMAVGKEFYDAVKIRKSKNGGKKRVLWYRDIPQKQI